MKQIYLFLILWLAAGATGASGQVFWTEDFNDGGANTRWQTENAGGSKTNPTPAGIAGLTYGTNDACNNYWIINDFNTPENNPAGVLPMGSTASYATRFVRGRRSNCTGVNSLPNPDPGGAVTNRSLHVTFKGCSDSYGFGLNEGPPDATDEYSILNAEGPASPGASNSEQWAVLTQDISTVGQCNIQLEAQFFLGGDAAGAHSYGTVLYSLNSGATWNILQDNITPTVFFIAGTCNNWETRNWTLPAAAEGITTLRLAFRWRNDGNQPPISTTADYTLGAGFNVDNIVLKQVGPTPDFNFGQQGSTILTTWTTCRNTNISTVNNVTTGAGVTGYFWSIPGATFAGGSSATDFEPVFFFDGTQPIGSKNVTLNVIYGSCTTSITRQVTVQACPPSIDFIAQYTTLCATNPAPVAGATTVNVMQNLSQSTPGQAPVTYTWTITGPGAVTYVNSTNANSVNPEVTFGAVGLYNVTLAASNADGAGIPRVRNSYINVINCQCGSAAAGSAVASFDWSANGNFLGWTSGPDVDANNTWAVNDNESGMPPNVCGTGGAGDRSLFYGAFGGFLGAAFLDACSFTLTQEFVQSPLINTTGFTNIIVQFDFMGDGGTSFASFQYSTNGGTLWNNPVPSAFNTTNPAVPVGSNMSNLKSDNTGCGGQGRWTRVTWNMPVACENNPNLRIRFIFNNVNDCGGVDPTFAVDNLLILGSAPPPAPATWTGVTSSDWGTASNWSSGAVPTAATSISIPDPVTLGAGRPMPVITANASVLNVCNNGTITIGNGATNVTLTIGGFLNNYGAITSTNTNAAADIAFNGADCRYRATAASLNHDVDYSVAGGVLTLEADLSCRSFNVAAGALNMSNVTLTQKRDFTRAAGTTFTTTTTSTLVFDGPMAASWTNPFSNPVGAVVTTQDVSGAQNINIGVATTFPNIIVRKQANANVATLASAFNYTVSNLLRIESGTLDANTRVFNGTANMEMTGGQFRTSRVVAAAQPVFSGNYTLTGGTIDWYGAGAQTIRLLPVAGSTAYYNMTMQGSGIKTLGAGTTTCNNAVSIAGTATVEVGTNTFNGAASLTMAASACSLRVSKTTGGPTLPELTGVYTLSNPSVIELYNAAAGTLTQTLRQPPAGSTNYANLLFNNTAGTMTRRLAGDIGVNNTVVMNNTGTAHTFDAQTNSFSGTASLTMNNNVLFRSALNGITFPEFTGTNTFNNTCTIEWYGTGTQSVRLNTTYKNMLFNNPGFRRILTGTTTASLSVIINAGVVEVQAGTDQFNGAAALTMNGGLFRIATGGATGTVPQFTGAYNLPAGRVSLIGAAQTLRSSVGFASANSYFELDFTGTGIKTLAGNVNVAENLYFNLPTTTGNYVNANGNILYLTKAVPGAAQRFGGHVVGNFRRQVNNTTGEYHFFVGSTGSGATFYEPALVNITTGLNPTTHITGSFSTANPSGSYATALTEGVYTYTNMATEGSWTLNADVQPTTAGEFDLELYPSSGWTSIPVGAVTTIAKRSDGTAPVAYQSWDFHSSSNTGAFRRDGYSSYFSEEAIIFDPTPPLPVEATPLTAQAQTRDILVRWQTFKEVNNHGFWLQRTTTPSDAATFANLTFVAAQSTTGASYGYVDQDVVPGVRYYYRYRQVDLNGAATFSNVAEAMLNPNAGTAEDPYLLNVYPNPFEQRVGFEFLLPSAETVSLTVMDASGRTLHHQALNAQPGLNRLEWNPSATLTAGVYLYRIQIGGKVYTGKVVRQ